MMLTSSTDYKAKKPCICYYVVVLHSRNSLVGENGLPVSETNPPSYRAGNLQKYLPTSFSPCCAELGELYKQGTIGFGTRPENTYNNLSQEIYFRGTKTTKKNNARLGEQKSNHSQYVDIAISYCPFCKAPIVVNSLATINDTTAGRFEANGSQV